MNSKIDTFLKQAKQWNKEMGTLREIILSCGLTEELKWRLPCYTIDDNNIVIIQPFKNYFAVMFFKGSLLKDPKKILATPGSSQAIRQIRFANTQEVLKMKSTIKSYIKEAIKIEKLGLKVELKKTKDFKVPEEFQKQLDKNKKLKTAFEALTPGRQRAYIFYFSAAKQSSTRQSRVEKCMPMILKGQGLNDNASAV